MSAEKEETDVLQLDFDKIPRIQKSVVPVVLQNADSGEVLYIGYADEEALRETIRRRIAVLYSTGRNQLWIKGETSGDYLDLTDIRVNCEQNSLLYLVKPRQKGVCHTKNENGTRETCYYRSLLTQSGELQFLEEKKQRISW